MRAWWDERSPRERVLIAVMAGGLLLFALWLAVAAPLLAAGRAAEARHARAVATRTGVDRALAELARLRPPPQPASASRALQAVVSETAVAGGVEIARIEPDPAGGLRVAVASAAPAALFPWLALLQREHGVALEHLSVMKNETGGLALDATLKRIGS